MAQVYGSRRAVTRIALMLILAIGGCAERPRIGVTITNAPVIPDCIQGSATKPCP